MKLKMEKAVSIALALTLALSMLLVATPQVFAQTTTVRFIPSPYDVTTMNEVFTVACVIEDVTDLSAIVIEMHWDTNYLEYVSHTNTYPVETYNTPIPPSPYAGVLTGSVSELPGMGVDPVAGKQRIDVFTLPATRFNGSGTVFVMTFRAINQPFGNPANYFETYLNFTEVTLVDHTATQIPATVEDGVIRIHELEFFYPPIPLLKVEPELFEASSLGEEFDSTVWLMGKNLTTGEVKDLSPFWDVAGIDVVMNFDPTLIQAVNLAIDPYGDFAAFWPNGIYVFTNETDNVAGTVHVAFVGIPGPGGVHTAPYGKLRMFNVTFQSILESTTFPPPSAPIYLKNPTAYTGDYVFDSIGGLIDIYSPVGTAWHELSPTFGDGPFELLSWDDNGDGMLSPSDQFVLNNTADGFYFDYHLNYITGTLNLTQQPFQTVDPYVWAASFGPDNLYYNGLPGYYVGDDDPYNGFGVPYWTGNFSVTYGISSVNSITVHALPFTPDEYTYTLVEGVDYKVYPDEDKIELLTPVDVPIINECWQDGVNNSLNGWPYINYVASGIESVFVDMHNGTARFGRNLGYAQPPPSEWWFDPDWTWELEGWWALGYFVGPFNWPAGSTWWINYTAASYLEIDYNADPDPNPRYIEFNGTYADFLLALTSPNGTDWNEAYPRSWRDYTVVGWTDSDTSTTVNPSDYLTFYEHETGELRTYHVEDITVDIGASRKPWICEEDPGDAFFGWAPIVSVAGFPQPDNDKCPWHNKDYSVPLPHVVEDATFVAPFKPLGGFIDVYTQYPDPYGGQGKDRPSDMFWPQKEVILYANVTYAGWPEQNKDVAFEIKFPNGTVYTIMYNRTNSVGVAFVRVRLPWPCDDPEAIFGEWHVWATVDVACIVVNDTLNFKYDYKVNIWDVTTDKSEYKHCEDITITIDYGSYIIQKTLFGEDNNITFTVTVTDASGVPFGFAYVVKTLGTDDMGDYCSYINGTVVLTVHVVKWARPPIGTIYVGALNGFPQNGGSAETPVFIIQISILAEWA